MNQYKPISCELHSQLELAIIKKQKLKLKLANSLDFITIEAIDIYIKNKSEFLIYKNIKNGLLFEIRLDQIQSFDLI